VRLTSINGVCSAGRTRGGPRDAGVHAAGFSGAVAGVLIATFSSAPTKAHCPRSRRSAAGSSRSRLNSRTPRCPWPRRKRWIFLCWAVPARGSRKISAWSARWPRNCLLHCGRKQVFPGYQWRRKLGNAGASDLCHREAWPGGIRVCRYRLSSSLCARGHYRDAALAGDAGCSPRLSWGRPAVAVNGLQCRLCRGGTRDRRFPARSSSR